MKINTQRLKRRWKWYVAYVVVFSLCFALFYAYDHVQDQQTAQMLEDDSSYETHLDDTAITSLRTEEVPAFDQANLNRENHK